MSGLVKYDNMDLIIETLTPFISKSYQSIMVTEHDAVHFLQAMRQGLMAVGEIYTQVSFQQSQSSLKLERTEARLRLEEFPEFAREKNIIKATEADRKAFIVLHDDYARSYGEHAKWVAIGKYLETVRSNFYNTIDEVKKTIYGKTHYNNLQIKG